MSAQSQALEQEHRRARPSEFVTREARWELLRRAIRMPYVSGIKCVSRSCHWQLTFPRTVIRPYGITPEERIKAAAREPVIEYPPSVQDEEDEIASLLVKRPFAIWITWRVWWSDVDLKKLASERQDDEVFARLTADGWTFPETDETYFKLKRVPPRERAE